MKNLSFILIAVFVFNVFPFVDTADAQLEAFFHIEVESCSSGDCEVVNRQYTGFVTHYVINIRCMDSAGNFGAWHTWEYEGINPGSYCNS